MEGLNPGARFVDLAALSLSGSLVPSVPTQLMIKYDPPKMTIVYHFEQRRNQQFYHDINIDEKMLATKSTDDVVSHLYVTEAYYFNPKQVKRSQLIRLVGMLQQNINRGQKTKNQFQQPAAQSQINIQDNAFGGGQELDKAREARRKNFFEKKRFINYPYSNPTDEHDSSDGGSQQVSAPGANDKIFSNEQRRGVPNEIALNQRKRFDDLQIQNKVPSLSP